MEISFLFTVIILIMSVVIHEFSHGCMAYLLGDSTAKNAGRLTLNPLAHLDFFGSLVVPLIAYFSAGFMFGWAKPVPYNPYNLKNQKYGDALVAVAGPASNLFIVLFFGLLLRLITFSGVLVNVIPAFHIIILVNLVLVIFNLIPIPPLDGGRVAVALLPEKYSDTLASLENYGMMIVLFLLLFPILPIQPLIFRTANLIFILFFPGLPTI